MTRTMLLLLLVASTTAPGSQVPGESSLCADTSNDHWHVDPCLSLDWRTVATLRVNARVIPVGPEQRRGGIDGLR
jgi:hypothetical protein